MTEDHETNVTDSELVAHMTTALETVLMYMTNVNSVEPVTVANRVIQSLKKAGYDEQSLDDAAASMLMGVSSLPSSDARVALHELCEAVFAYKKADEVYWDIGPNGIGPHRHAREAAEDNMFAIASKYQAPPAASQPQNEGYDK